MVLPIPFSPVATMNGLYQHFETVGFHICFTTGYSDSTLIRAIESRMVSIRRIPADMKYNLKFLGTCNQDSLPAAGYLLCFGTKGNYRQER